MLDLIGIWGWWLLSLFICCYCTQQLGKTIFETLDNKESLLSVISEHSVPFGSMDMLKDPCLLRYYQNFITNTTSSGGYKATFLTYAS